VGARLLRTFLGVWDGPDGRARLLAVVRSMLTDEHAARTFREFLLDAVLGPLTRGLDTTDAELRGTLVASQLVGMAVVRYGIRVEPLASADHDTIVAALAPTLQRYITGDLSA
ncbi:MAG: TetR/AcrR family transcriptional regulator, partial [Egibacteraceae bacterium]